MASLLSKAVDVNFVLTLKTRWSMDTQNICLCSAEMETVIIGMVKGVRRSRFESQTKDADLFKIPEKLEKWETTLFYFILKQSTFVESWCWFVNINDFFWTAWKVVTPEPITIVIKLCSVTLWKIMEAKRTSVVTYMLMEPHKKLAYYCTLY